MKKSIEYSVLLLLLIPLFFINIKTSHDWGDDFAQYLHQAKNITQGISQNETGYVFNKDVFLGPQAYPVGFPLLLAPFVKHYGLNFEVLNYLMTTFLALSCLFGFLILRGRFSFITALFTTLIIAYNPVMLNFKTEVVSDLAFTTFLMACIYLIPKNKNTLIALLLGLLMGLLAHIRAIGILMIIVFVIHNLFFENKITSFTIQKHKLSGLTLLSFSLIYISLKFGFPCNTNYPSFFEFNGLLDRTTEHLSYNTLSLSTFFNIYEPKNQYFIGVISSSALVVFSILGFLYNWKTSKFSFTNLFVLAYISCIAIFKFSDAGIRFIVPILFLIFYYAIIGLKQSLKDIVTNWQITSIVFGLIIILSYKPAIEKLFDTTKNVIDGPCTDASYDMFNKIKSLNLSNGIIVFEKPRALALFTNTKSIALKNDISNSEIEKQLKHYNATHLLINKSIPNEALANYIASDSLNTSLIYSNVDYQFYKLR